MIAFTAGVWAAPGTASAVDWTTTTTIYDDPAGGNVQSIAVGTSDGQTYAVADILDAAGHKLYFRRHDGANLRSRTLISSALSTFPGDFYLPSVTAMDGLPTVAVSARMCVASVPGDCTQAGLDELVINRNTGAVVSTWPIDDRVSHVKHGVVHLDPITFQVHGCWTEEVAGLGDETLCSERDPFLAWNAPALIGTGAGDQDHVTLAVDQAGDRVVLWHDATNVGTDLELLHDANPLSVQYGGGDQDNGKGSVNRVPGQRGSLCMFRRVLGRQCHARASAPPEMIRGRIEEVKGLSIDAGEADRAHVQRRERGKPCSASSTTSPSLRVPGEQSR